MIRTKIIPKLSTQKQSVAQTLTLLKVRAKMIIINKPYNHWPTRRASSLPVMWWVMISTKICAAPKKEELGRIFWRKRQIQPFKLLKMLSLTTTIWKSQWIKSSYGKKKKIFKSSRTQLFWMSFIWISDRHNIWTLLFV